MCLCSGLLIGLLVTKVVTVTDIRNMFINGFQGLVSRFDKSVTGNDGLYSSTRVESYLWHFGGFALIAIAVFKNIKIPDSVMYLLGGVLGVNNVRSAYNKFQEISTSVTKVEGDSANG